MEYMKIRQDLSHGLNPLIFFIGFLLFFCCYQTVFFFCHLFWISIPCVLFFMITPIGNQRLSITDEPRLGFFKWFFRIIILQLVLMGVYAGISIVTGQALVVNAIDHPALFTTTLQNMWVNGLFPWTIYGCVIVGMGILAYRQQKDAYASSVIQSITHQDLQGTYSLIANVIMKRSAHFAVGVTIAFMILLLISFVSSPLHVSGGFQMVNLFCTLVLMSLMFTKKIKDIIQKTFSRTIPTALSFPMTAITIALLVLLLVKFLGGLSQGATDQPLFPFLQAWANHPWHQGWMLFSIMWWLSLTPLIGSYVLRISRGYRIRTVLVGILFLPILTASCIYYAHDITVSLFLPAIYLKIIALISFLIALPLLLNHQNAEEIMLAFFPSNGAIKHRDTQTFFFKILQYTLLFFYLYWVIGVNGVSLVYFSGCFLLLILLPLMMMAIIARSRIR